MSDNLIKIFIADDNQALCESLRNSILIELEKFDMTKHDVEINVVFTNQAYEAGCKFIDKGYVPDICIFDLIFNGYTGVDLYKYLISKTDKKIDLCVYTGVEKSFDRRREAELLSTNMQNLVTIIEKPDIENILSWFNKLLKEKYNKKSIIYQYDDGGDTFDNL